MVNYKKSVFILARPAFKNLDLRNIGGVIVSSRLLLKEFDRLYISYTVLDTYRERWKFLSLIPILLASIKNIRSSKITFLNLNEREIIFLGIPLVFFSKIMKKKIIVRFFGGNQDIHYKSSWAYKIALNFLFTNSDHVLLQTRHLCNFFDSDKSYWFPTARPLLPFKTKYNKFTKTKKLKIVFIGNVCRTKGIHLLIDAAKQLGSSVDITVYGPLVNISLDEMKEVGIVYGGVLSYDTVHNTLRKFDYLCLPTIHDGEGYPGCILEAFNAGLPVISSCWRSIPELVKENETGILFEPGNSIDLVAAINKAKKNKMDGMRYNLLDTAQDFDTKRIYTKLSHNLLR